MEPMNVYDRLNDKRSYTGVYRKRFEGDGRINGDTQTSHMRKYGNKKYSGETNTRTDENIHCSSVLMRPNLNYRATKTAYYENNKAAMVPPPAPTGVSSSNPATSSSPPKSPIIVASTITQASETTPSTLISPPDLSDPHTVLKFVFTYYCRFGRTSAQGPDIKTLDNANFVKFCRECPLLIDTTFTEPFADLIFVKSKKKGARRITYARFLDALGMIALQKFPESDLEESVPYLLDNYIGLLPCLKEKSSPVHYPVFESNVTVPKPKRLSLTIGEILPLPPSNPEKQHQPQQHDSNNSRYSLAAEEQPPQTY